MKKGDLARFLALTVPAALVRLWAGWALAERIWRQMEWTSGWF